MTKTYTHNTEDIMETYTPEWFVCLGCGRMFRGSLEAFRAMTGTDDTPRDGRGNITLDECGSCAEVIAAGEKANATKYARIHRND